MTGCDAISPHTATSSPAARPMSTVRLMSRSTAGCSGVNRDARFTLPRSTASVYCTRSFVPTLKNATSRASVSALIAAGMPTRLFYVTYPGNSFDTHVQQADLHSRLLMYTADAVRGFVADLERLGRADDVAIMIFTEFGRRVEENGSLGTDHGTATPMFVVGKGVKGGFYGRHPSLTDLDDGNMKMTTDFRRVYATMIEEWLGCREAQTILKGRFEPLGVFA